MMNRKRQQRWSSRWPVVPVVALAAVVAFGCQKERQIEHPDPDEAWQQAHDVEVDDGEIVATVDGRPIRGVDVKAAWRDMPDKSAREVVEQLVERDILARHAHEEGYHRRPEVAFARKQGLASALLEREVEQKAEVDESRRQPVMDHVERTRRAPEGLRASHLVVLVPRELEDDDGESVNLDDEQREALYDSARDYTDRALELLEGQVDDDALRQVAEQLNDEVLPDELEATVNIHLRFPRHGEQYDRAHLPDGWTSVVPRFSEGAESVIDDDSPGQRLSAPVRTEYGWHLIRVDEIIDARPVDPQAAEEYVQFELETGAREAKLHQNFEQWADGISVELYPDRLGSVLDE